MHTMLVPSKELLLGLPTLLVASRALPEGRGYLVVLIAFPVSQAALIATFLVASNLLGALTPGGAAGAR
eukprot:949183-Prymnesium_polylepis.1